jgi:prepilin-type N-terminal cleavage/methylation domain-containing protein
MKGNTRTTERGFSLLEMILVVGILSLVLAVTMTAINDVQKRARVEDAKVDLTQESREFVEQMVRDVHQAGYPTVGMYATGSATPVTSYAAGLLTATTTSISFEGDVDGDGAVDVVQYQLFDSNGAQIGPCPCTLQRSQVAKTVGAPGTNFTQQVDSVINSTGTGAWFISGTTAAFPHDTRYASYKTDPIFRYYDQFGVELTPPLVVANVRSIRITVNTLSSVVDPVTGTYPASSMTASARIANK